MTTYVRKTIDVYEIQRNYGYGDGANQSRAQNMDEREPGNLCRYVRKIIAITFSAD